MENKLLYLYLQTLLPDLDGYMNLHYSEVFKNEIQKWCSSIIEPLFASMKKEKALQECYSLITDSWTEEDQKKFIFYLRTFLESLDWSPELERKCILSQVTSLSEAMMLYDKSLENFNLVGCPIRLRDLRKENVQFQITSKQQDCSLLIRGVDYVWRSTDGKVQYTEAKQLRPCQVFVKIPNTLFLLGAYKNQLFLSKLGEKHCFACLETSIKEIDYLDCEIIPSGSIVITIGKRNLDTGGLLQTECMAFRLDTNLVAITLSKEEAEEAEQAANKDVQSYDFSYQSSPLSAHTINPWKSQIIYKDSILNEFAYGTVLGVYGVPSNYKVAFASGLYIHVKNQEIISNNDIGIACSSAVFLK